MALWGICFVLAAFGTTIYGDSSLTYPEVARNGARIVSGWEAVPGQLPFQLSIRMVTAVGGVVSCGASIIHSNWGLTAAHCTANRFTIIVRAGAVNLTRPGVIFETLDYWNHPSYNPNLGIVQPNDIGLIRFNRDLVFNDYIQPVRMQRSADKDRNYDGDRLTASGWGITWTQGSSPENLNWVYLLGTSNEFCRASFGGSSTIQDSTICASGYNDTTQSTCSGDSGGPLTVVDPDGIVTEVGVASFVSASGCHVDLPAGFVRPGHYHDWYYEVTGINFDWDFEDASDEDSKSEESEEEPASESSEEPDSESEETSPESEEEPAPDSSEEPDSESEETPAPESEEEPAPDSSEEPSSESDEAPAPESEEEPAPESSEEPGSGSEEEPAPESEEEPAPESEEDIETVFKRFWKSFQIFKVL